MRGLVIAAALGALTLAGLAALSTVPGGAVAGGASCTYEQRQARTAALARFREEMAAKRRAYFRRHKSKAKRAAFVKRQRKTLAALRSAATCSVPPLAPSSGASCSFMLTPATEVDRARTTDARLPLHEGATVPGDFLHSRGQVRAVFLLVDFPDAPADQPADSVGPLYLPDTAYFDEVSYGRFSLAVDLVPGWIRMPRPMSAYDSLGVHMPEFLRDAVAAADPVVDFSRYNLAFVVPTRAFLAGAVSQGVAFRAGFGYTADRVELRFFATLQPDVLQFGRGAAAIANHELMHTFGLPDTRDSPQKSGGWDAMGDLPGSAPNPSTHLLGWHKWRLGWLDPEQLTCLDAPGRLDETISAIAAPGGKKLVVVPTGPWTTYVVEARRQVGYDRGVCEEGVLVYHVDSRPIRGQVVDGNGPVNLKGPAGRCQAGVAGAFQTGEAFEDDRVRVEVLARDETSFRVRATKK